MNRKTGLAWLARILCAGFVLAFFLSLGANATQSGHECHDDECVVCLCLNRTAQLLKGLATAAAAAAVGALSLRAVRTAAVAVQRRTVYHSPVLLGDRIDS